MADDSNQPGCPFSGEPGEVGAARIADATDMAYGDYLALDGILDAQHPHSPDHNEMLFIIQHQTSELWMKLIIHELGGALEAIREDRVAEAMKMLARVTRIFEQLLSAWTVLSTLTPSEYSTIRDYLGESSGFQSWQYRQIEFMLGNKNASMLDAHLSRPARHAAVKAAFEAPSVYDEVLALASRRGHQVPDELLDRDWTHAHKRSQAIVDLWTCVYSNPSDHWDLYAVAEKLVDVEDMFRQWRFRHVTTVERIIGFKMGTGGTSGVNYLRRMLDVVLFPELWEVRTTL